MGYFEENPHVEYNQGLYDYYINEVKTFNERLEAYQREVNEKLADQDEEIASFKNLVNGQINDLRGQLRDFETEINNDFIDYKAEVNGTITEFERDFNTQYELDLSRFESEVNTINHNITQYLETNLPTLVSEDEELKEAIVAAAGVVGWNYINFFDYTLNYQDIEHDNVQIPVNDKPGTYIILIVDDIDGAAAQYIVNYSEDVPNGNAVEVCNTFASAAPIVVDPASNIIDLHYDGNSYSSGSHHYAKVYLQKALPTAE